MPAGRAFDSLEGGGFVTSGSSNVFIGDKAIDISDLLPKMTPPKLPERALKLSESFLKEIKELENLVNNQQFSETNSNTIKNDKQNNKTENIIVIGSEFLYNSFWWKMIFMACGYAVAKGSIIPPGYSSNIDLTTVLIVDYGYSEVELQRIKDGITTLPNRELVMLKEQEQLENFLLTREKNNNFYKIKNIIVFSHGVPHTIDLNYKYKPNIPLTINEYLVNKLSHKLFADSAIFFLMHVAPVLELECYQNLCQVI